MYRASRMDHRYGSLLLQELVLLKKGFAGEVDIVVFLVCCFGPPFLRCMVSQKERVVVVSPMSVWLWSSQFLPWEENW